MIFVILSIVLSISTAFFAYQSFRLGKLILKTQDAIEASLDVLDERYKSVTEILQKPVFFDSLEVRQVIEDIAISRDAILFVANSMVDAQKETPDAQENSEKEESS
jgi:hypothetical protein